LRACDFGAPTIRKRLFLIARRDHAPIIWPDPTHADPADPRVVSGQIKAWRSAAECIDWSIPCPSIFLSREEARKVGARRPLAQATMERTARGVHRYVLNSDNPFLIPTLMQELDHAAFIQSQYGASIGARIDRPLQTITAGGGGKAALVAAFLGQQNTGLIGRDARLPLSTIVGTGSTQTIAAVHLQNLYGSNTGASGGDIQKPIGAVTANGQHTALVAAFLTKYYKTPQNQKLIDPLATITTKARFALSTVVINSKKWTITDIGIRMLSPRELYAAQGFPKGYEYEYGLNAKFERIKLTKTAQIRMCGNSVSPVCARALVAAQLPKTAKSFAVAA